jgi:uncharacterized membrane protein YgcG
MVARFLLTVLFLLAPATVLAPTAAAQDRDTVSDEAGVLSPADEREVQSAFDQVGAESGDPLYAFLVSDTNVEGAERQELLLDQAREAGVPPDAGVILVDTEDRWDLVRVAGDSDQAVHNAMAPHFSDGDFAEGLLAGAAEIQDNLSVLPELLTAVGVLGAVALLAGGVFFLRNRHRKERELEEQRQIAEREFAELTERMDEFGERERLVAGYLEALRPLLDQRCEEEVEARIQDSRSAGFGREFSEAASYLTSDPKAARERIEHGRRLLEGALEGLSEAESTMDHYRAADEALEGRLRAAAEEIAAAEVAERSALEAGVAVEPLDLRPEYDRLARETADRAARREEFDPRETLAAIDTLIERVRERQAALEAEVSARSALPEEISSTEDALLRARETLEEYGRVYAAEQNRWGPAALEDAPAPEELSTDLRRAASSIERAGTAEADGRFLEALSLLEEATETARAVMRSPAGLKAAVAGADRRRREGEKKLKELEARLEQAKANRHRMSPRQHRQLRDYERRLDDARGGFFGADWLTALLVFEALDHDYAYMGDPASFAPGDWGGGDWGDFGGGDFGGGDFGGGGF